MNASELTVELATIKEQFQNGRKDIDELSLEVKELDRSLVLLRDEQIATRTLLDVHVRQTEKWDNRIWMIVGLFLGSALSLSGSLIVNAIKR